MVPTRVPKGQAMGSKISPKRRGPKWAPMGPRYGPLKEGSIMSPMNRDPEWVPMGSELGPFSRVPQCHPTQGIQNGSLWVPNWVPSLEFHNVTLHKGPILGPSRVSYFGQPFWFPIWNQLEPPGRSVWEQSSDSVGRPGAIWRLKNPPKYYNFSSLYRTLKTGFGRT